MGYNKDIEKHKIKNREYKEKNKERILNAHRIYNAEHKKEIREKRIRELYNMSSETYIALFDSQNGKCAICGLYSKIDLAVDHDHKTGKIRGLLCKSCNLSLGHAKDNIDVLEKMILYLKRFL